jgi:EAL and modified HD-GYP domain-containing signal transduction protein
MPDFFIGRQAILDRNLKLHAYELLYRNGSLNAAPSQIDHDSATSQVIMTAFTEIGIDKLVGNHLAFVNIPYKFITEPDLLPMQPDQVVLEILEDVEIDEACINGIRNLSDSGFAIALDDFIYDKKYDVIMPFVTVIKMDITLTSKEQWAKQIEQFKSFGCKVLAEKVETFEEFDYLKSLNVDYFQGYFFAKPKVISGKRIASNSIVLLQMMAKINDPNTDIEELQNIISKDVGISVRALNYVNSPASGLNRKVDSIREAILYLGRSAVKSWVSLSMMASVDDKPDELMTMALIRAKFCELIATASDCEGVDSFFTVGLFSILDSLLDAELEEVLEPMSLNSEMLSALVEHQGEKGIALSCAMSLEFGLADGLSFAQLGEDELTELHFEAVQWADKAMAELLG